MALVKEVFVSFLLQDQPVKEFHFHYSHFPPKYSKIKTYGSSDINCNSPSPPLSFS